MKTVLHVGCGAQGILHESFCNSEWHEVRLDVNAGVKPDIVSSMHSMPMVDSDSVDAVWSSHGLEHLEAHEAELALREFIRVLVPDGFALITVPDLGQVAEALLKGGLDVPAYSSPAGPICPIDMLYGNRQWILQGNGFQAHRTGFTKATLERALWLSGFGSVRVKTGYFDLWAVASKSVESVTLKQAAEERA